MICSQNLRGCLLWSARVRWSIKGIWRECRGLTFKTFNYIRSKRNMKPIKRGSFKSGYSRFWKRIWKLDNQTSGLWLSEPFWLSMRSVTWLGLCPSGPHMRSGVGPACAPVFKVSAGETEWESHLDRKPAHEKGDTATSLLSELLSKKAFHGVDVFCVRKSIDLTFLVFQCL
jgi:hypothetical protein